MVITWSDIMVFDVVPSDLNHLETMSWVISLLEWGLDIMLCF